MTFYLTLTPDGVFVQVRAEGDGIVGDATRLVRPGETFFDLSYEQLFALGDGEHSLD